MGRKIYYSKVSLNSQDVYKLTENTEFKYELVRNIINMLNNDSRLEDSYVYTTNSGEEKNETVIYELRIREKDDEVIWGTFYRTSHIFVKSRDEYTGEMKNRPVENTEDVEFYYDVLHEYVAFVLRRRFGYQMFNKAFAKLLNQCAKSRGLEYNFYLELFNAGMSLEDIQTLIKEDKNITELIITYRPVNPDEGIIEAAKAAKEKERLEASNATERSVIYKARGKKYINGSADIIQDDLLFAAGINTDLSVEDQTQRGYLNVNVVNDKGDITSTAEKRPFVKGLNNIHEFKDIAKSGILEILRKAVHCDS